MKATTAASENLIMTIKDDDFPHGKGGTVVTKQIDLEPLRKPMEDGGLKLLIEMLRDTHHNYSCLIMENEMNDETHYLNSCMTDHLFFLKILAEAFEEIRENAKTI